MNQNINISSLSTGYANKVILDAVDLSSKKNQLIALIGRNGTGKSTLLKTLAGLHPHLNGSFHFNGTNMFDLSNDKRAQLLSIVSTKASYIDNIVVKDFIGFGRYPYTNWLGIKNNTDDFLINKAISICSIEEFSERNYQTLSDGEKQRVNIARAIAQDTPIIFLDEPTAHLDLVNKIEVLKLLKELTSNQEKTIIYATHQIEYAIQLSDELWVLNNSQLNSYTPSQLIEQDILSQVIDSPSIEFDKTSGFFKIR